MACLDVIDARDIPDFNRKTENGASVQWPKSRGTLSNKMNAIEYHELQLGPVQFRLF